MRELFWYHPTHMMYLIEILVEGKGNLYGKNLMSISPKGPNVKHGVSYFMKDVSNDITPFKRGELKGLEEVKFENKNHLLIEGVFYEN